MKRRAGTGRGVVVAGHAVAVGPGEVESVGIIGNKSNQSSKKQESLDLGTLLFPSTSSDQSNL